MGAHKMTAGPWHKYNSRECTILDSLDRLDDRTYHIYADSFDEMGIHVARNMTPEDARAIEAVPDMLEALKAIYYGAEDKGLLDHDAAVMVMNALTKATGDVYE
jgi:hypothetical protein